MPKLPNINPKIVIKFLEAEGFVLDHSTGSHFVYYHETNQKRVVVPMHSKDIPKGTLLSIIKMAGFGKDDLADFLS